MTARTAPQGRPITPGRQAEGTRVRARLPLFQHRNFHVELREHELITVSMKWMTVVRWRTSPESVRASGWIPWRVGFIVVTFKIDW